MAAGSHLGTFNAEFPTCTDGIILAGNSEQAQQTQLSVVTGFADDNHYDIHPTKLITDSHGKVGKVQLLIDFTSVPYIKSLRHLRTDIRHYQVAIIADL